MITKTPLGSITPSSNWVLVGSVAPLFHVSMEYPSRLMATGEGLYSSMALLLLLPSMYSEMKSSSQKLALVQSKISTSKNELLKLSHSTP